MNVLLLDQYSDPGGAQQVLLEFLPALQRNGSRALVGLPGDGSLFDSVRDLGIPVERIDAWSPSSPEKYSGRAGFAAASFRLASQIRKMARRTAADLVYLNGPRLVPAAALARLSCPVMFHSHSWLPAGRARSVTGFALRWMNASVVANCNFVAEQWQPYLGAARVSVILNGVAGPVEGLRRQPGSPPRIGCIGRISAEKGQREFVAAAARIHQALPDCRFTVYGDAMFGNAESQRYAEEVRAAANGLPIEFRGWVRDVYQALAELDLLLVPSLGPEATTRVILEAFAARVPVIAFDTGGISEVVYDGVTGVLTRSVEEMAHAAVGSLSGDPERRGTIACAARADWERRFTREKFQSQLLAAMEIAAAPTR